VEKVKENSPGGEKTTPNPNGSIAQFSEVFCRFDEPPNCKPKSEDEAAAAAGNET